VPADQRVRLEDGNSGEAAGPDPIQPNPEEALVKAGSQPFVVPCGDHRQLLTKRQDLQMEEGPATEQARQGNEQRQARQGNEQRGEERLRRDYATVREEKKPTRSIGTTFLVGTTLAPPEPGWSVGQIASPFVSCETVKP